MATVRLGGGWAWRSKTGVDRQYVADTCKHGRRKAHSFDDALGCGMLDAVRKARGVSREHAARAMGVTLSAVHKWARGERLPKGLYRRALEVWLLNTP